MGIFFPRVQPESRRIDLKDKQIKYLPNKIDTAKYNLITFLPKSLLLQFTRLSNIVFLVNAILQGIPIISSIPPITAISPLAFVLALSMLREGYQDYKRHKKDWQINSRTTSVLRQQRFVEVEWDEIKVGDFIKVRSGQIIPADIILVSSSSEIGVCYVQTSNLDGENNLKQKHVIAQGFEQLRKKLQAQAYNGLINVDNPTSNLYQFSGTIEAEPTQPIVLAYKNLLLRQTVLKNTEEVIGLAVYCGHDTKILKNQGKIHHKMSKMEKQVNYIQIGLVFILLIFCAISSTGYYYVHQKYHLREKGSYIPSLGLPSLYLQSVVMFFAIFLLLNFLIPITLNILIEGIKTFSGIFLSFDRKLYDESIDKRCGVLNSSIIEQLGFVDCILTDKTGTLTSNEMVFKGIAIQQKVYSREQIEQSISSLRERQQFYDFMLGMVICHDVIWDSKKNEYQGSSPDEVCFVNFASTVGFRFIEKIRNRIKIQIDERELRIKVLEIIPFSSRRRMSLLVEKQSKNQVVMYTKGADSAIFQKSHWYRGSEVFSTNVNAFARQGLRTLVFTKKVMKIQKFKQYKFRKQSIQWKLRQCEISKEEAAEMENSLIEQIESNLEIIGATAIQDRLQEDVPQTLSRLQQADIKIMMITGDKLQTAQNIGYLSHLIKQSYAVFKISADVEDAYEEAVNIRNAVLMDKLLFTLIIQGRNITQMMRQTNQQKLKLYVSLLSKAKSVIFCRSSPKQKAIIVKFTKEKMNFITLAIGDGGNDVGMIEQAHVGIGILGKQGNTAAAVSDFSFGKFKFLDRLILHHGRWFYYRLSYFFIFFGTKNMAVTAVIFFYLFESAFSGTLIYSALLYMLYNGFIGVCILVHFGLYDQDINDDLEDEIWNHLPQIYKQAKSKELFTYKRYALWSFSGATLAVIEYFIVRYSLLEDQTSPNGYPFDFNSSQIIHGIILTFVIISLNYIDTQSHSNFFVYLIFGVCSVASSMAYFIAQNYMPQLSEYHVYNDNFNLTYFFTIFIIIASVILYKIGYSCYLVEYFPSIIDLYKVSNDQDPHQKVEIFRHLLKDRQSLSFRSHAKLKDSLAAQNESRQWTSNMENNSKIVIEKDRKYLSAAVRICNTQLSISEDSQ